MHSHATSLMIFNLIVGQLEIYNDATLNSEQVTSTAWNGLSFICYIIKYMIIPFSSRGGSYSALTYNFQGIPQVIILVIQLESL